MGDLALKIDGVVELAMAKCDEKKLLFVDLFPPKKFLKFNFITKFFCLGWEIWLENGCHLIVKINRY